MTPRTDMSFRRRVRDSHGQMTIMFILWWPILFLFAFLITDLAQIINNKVRLQLTADSASLAGALVQAEGLNDVATANGTINAIWNSFYKRATQGPPYPNKAAADTHRGTTEARIRAEQNRILNDLNRRYPPQAQRRAERIARANYGPARYSFASDSTLRTRLFVPKRKVKRVSVPYRYYVATPNGVVIRRGVHRMTFAPYGLGIEKAPGFRTYFTVKMTLPPEALAAGTAPFRKARTVEAAAVAQAKPYGGYLYHPTWHVGVPMYRGKLIPMSAPLPNPPELPHVAAYAH